MGRRKTAGWGIGIAAFALCGLCGSITAACDDSDSPPSRPVVQTSAPITSAPVTVMPTTAAPTTAAPKPKATTAKPKPSPARTTSRPKPKPTTARPSSVYYANCSAAREAGAAPLYRGDPGYRSGLDRDSDGVACE